MPSLISRLRFAALLVLALTLAACRDEQTVVHSESVDYDSSAAKAADSTAPGISSDSLKAGANDWILIPGEAAGLTHIDEDVNALRARLGPPDAGDAGMQKSVAVWYADHDASLNSLVVFASRGPGGSEAARIREIRVTSPRFETVRGVRVGTTERDIRAHYEVKDAEQFRAKDGSMSKILDAPEGIAFEIGADGVCDAIIIHSPGSARYGSYLKLCY